MPLGPEVTLDLVDPRRQLGLGSAVCQVERTYARDQQRREPVRGHRGRITVVRRHVDVHQLRIRHGSDIDTRALRKPRIPNELTDETSTRREIGVCVLKPVDVREIVGTDLIARDARACRDVDHGGCRVIRPLREGEYERAQRRAERNQPDHQLATPQDRQVRAPFAPAPLPRAQLSRLHDRRLPLITTKGGTPFKGALPGQGPDQTAANEIS